jgi:hypothetical protein
MEMRHYIECIKEGIQPITGGPEGMEVVRILEASNQSLKQKGASISLVQPRLAGNGNGKSIEVAAPDEAAKLVTA